MTDSEAIIIAKIMLTADSWCTECSNELLSQLSLAFQGQDQMIQSIRMSRGILQQAHYDNIREFNAGKSALLPVWEL